jgi:hypothetical protein
VRSTNTQSRPGDQPSRRANAGRNFIPGDPFLTILSIPLTPPVHLIPPRRPLPSYASHHYSEFGLHEVGSLHSTYTEHASRVTNLFTILDEQDVWVRGVTCEAFSVSSGITPPGGGHARNSVQDGMPVRVLRVKFEGWSEERVRKLFPPRGATGTRGGDLHVLEWCKISSEPRHREVVAQEATELGMTFIMPTLDFSSAFSETAAASLQQQRSPSLQRPGEEMTAYPIQSPWSSSYCPTPSGASAFDILDFDAMLSDVTNASSRDEFDGVEFFPDRISSTGTMDDDAFDASDEMGLEDQYDGDDDDAGSSEFWFPSSSSSASVSSSRRGRLGRPNANKGSIVIDDVAAAQLPMSDSRIAFSASFAERMA